MTSQASHCFYTHTHTHTHTLSLSLSLSLPLSLSLKMTLFFKQTNLCHFLTEEYLIIYRHRWIISWWSPQDSWHRPYLKHQTYVLFSSGLHCEILNQSQQSHRQPVSSPVWPSGLQQRQQLQRHLRQVHSPSGRGLCLLPDHHLGQQPWTCWARARQRRTCSGTRACRWVSKSEESRLHPGDHALGSWRTGVGTSAKRQCCWRGPLDSLHRLPFACWLNTVLYPACVPCASSWPNGQWQAYAILSCMDKFTETAVDESRLLLGWPTKFPKEGKQPHTKHMPASDQNWQKIKKMVVYLFIWFSVSYVERGSALHNSWCYHHRSTAVFVQSFQSILGLVGNRGRHVLAHIGPCGKTEAGTSWPILGLVGKQRQARLGPYWPLQGAEGFKHWVYKYCNVNNSGESPPTRPKRYCESMLWHTLLAGEDLCLC